MISGVYCLDPLPQTKVSFGQRYPRWPLFFCGVAFEPDGPAHRPLAGPMGAHSENRAGILAIVIGMVLITVNDSLVKSLSGDYALHQIIMARATIGGVILLGAVFAMGGLPILRITRPWLHATRSLMVVLANMFFFLALAVMPLAQVTALFFIAPLAITVMSVLFLGMTVGPHRIGALIVGFAGVLLMAGAEVLGAGGAGWAVLLPLLSALAYAWMQILTRALGPEAHPAAMAFYIQVGFFVVCVAFFICAGDGRYAPSPDAPVLHFLLRAWVWPEASDLWRFLAIGVVIAGVSWFMTQAYRLAEPATVAPFEYIAMPLATIWGIVFFAEFPGPTVWLGMVMIAGAGLYIVWRERKSPRGEKSS